MRVSPGIDEPEKVEGLSFFDPASVFETKGGLVQELEEAGRAVICVDTALNADQDLLRSIDAMLGPPCRTLSD